MTYFNYCRFLISLENVAYNFLKMPIFLHYFKNHPEFFLQNFQNFIEFLENIPSQFFRKYKNYAPGPP